MSSLDSYTLQYEDLTQITRKGGKDMKMSNNTKPEVVKTSKKYAKTRGEHYKDIVIAILVTSIFAFVGGMQFAKANQAKIDAAVKAVQPVAQAEAKK